MSAHDLSTRPIHLGRNATSSVEPQFTGSPQWYEDYISRHASDGAEGRLVSLFTFREPWEFWEMHPNGSEVVLCTAGRITLHQQHAGGARDTVTLGPGEYAINPPGTWHTADVEGEATAVFITCGLGTEHRPRARA